MESLLEQIMNDVYITEKQANKEKYVGHAKEVRISIQHYYELMTDPKIIQYVSDVRKVEIMGIPVIRDPKISKWEVIM